jgi:hypothetical protein
MIAMIIALFVKATRLCHAGWGGWLQAHPCFCFILLLRGSQ